MVNSNGTKRKCFHKCPESNSSGNVLTYDDFSTFCLIWTALFWILQNKPQEKCRKCGQETVQIATELRSVLSKLYKKTSLDPKSFERSLSIFEQFYECFTNNEPIYENRSQQTVSEDFSSNSSNSAQYNRTFIGFFQELVRSFTNTVFSFIPHEVLEENTTVLRRCPENAFQETLMTTDINISDVQNSKSTMTDDFDSVQIKNESYKSVLKDSKMKIQQRTSHLSAKCAATEEKLLRLAEEVNVMNLTINEVSKQQSLHNKDVAKILSSLRRMEKCFRSCKCKENTDTVKLTSSKTLSYRKSESNKSVYFSPDGRKYSTEILNTNLDINEQETQTKGCRCTNNLLENKDTSRSIATNWLSLNRYDLSEKELYCTTGSIHELKQEVDTLNNMLETIISNSRKQYDDMIVTSSELVHKLQKTYNARVKYVHNKYARRLEELKKTITPCPVGKQGNVDNPRRTVKCCVRDVKMKL